jgi:uncharacterized membrane protein YfcA
VVNIALTKGTIIGAVIGGLASFFMLENVTQKLFGYPVSTSTLYTALSTHTTAAYTQDITTALLTVALFAVIGGFVGYLMTKRGG